MIVVSVTLKSAIHPSRDKELARMEICNDGTSDNPRRGNYQAWTKRGRSKEALDTGAKHRLARLVNWPRLDKHVWYMVGTILMKMGYVSPEHASCEAHVQGALTLGQLDVLNHLLDQKDSKAPPTACR